MNNNNKVQIPHLAIISLFSGVSSLLVLLLSFIIGIFVESIGIVSFFGFVFVLGLVGIICGILGRTKIKKEKLKGIGISNIGIILGGIAILLTIFLRFAVFLFFIPWIGA